ncbi:TadE/TadG family type IV pilus assembly protein [Rossellomorea vietnamensis]|uniref:TadE/TadG family type IV pilus assembly protein n=1 Tax=Rossellomorea vietnamensis TaxID=218284 RepID=UPI003D2E15E9
MLKRLLINNKGSISLEFIGVLPFFFLFMLLVFQGFVLGYALITAQSAVNEAAKVYSEGDTLSESREAAQKIVGNSSYLTLNSLSIPSQDSDGDFEVNANVSIDLMFIPDKWKSVSSITFNQTASSRVIDSEFN